MLTPPPILVTAVPFAGDAYGRQSQGGLRPRAGGGRQPGMSGAAILCAGDAIPGRSRVVRPAVPADILAIVAGGNPCYMTAPLPV